MKPARKFLAIDQDPNAKENRGRHPASYASDAAWSAKCRVQLNVKAICPGQGACIGSRVGNHSTQVYAWRSTRRTKFNVQNGHRFARIRRVIRKARTTHHARCIFLAHACYEGIAPGLLRLVKHGNRAGARCDHGTIREADPFSAIFVQQSIAIGPVGGFILAPIRMNLLGNFPRQLVGKTLHGYLRFETSAKKNRRKRRAIYHFNSTDQYALSRKVFHD
jgi:hypothetical protein